MTSEVFRPIFFRDEGAVAAHADDVIAGKLVLVFDREDEAADGVVVGLLKVFVDRFERRNGGAQVLSVFFQLAVGSIEFFLLRLGVFINFREILGVFF